MAERADWVAQQRRDAWHFGRNLAADLTERYRQHYRLPQAPVPALIIDELLTDFLGAELHFDPLPPDRFAQTRWIRGNPVVTINSRTDLIEGVKDTEGVQRVASWHEAIHIVEGGDEARSIHERTLPGMGEPAPIICFREPGRRRQTPGISREFRAEEAGRAAACSIWAMERTPAYRELVARAAERPDGEVVRGWPLLYEIAASLHVNISALVTQLTLEDRLVVEPRGKRLWVPKSMFSRGESWESQ